MNRTPLATLAIALAAAPAAGALAAPLAASMNLRADVGIGGAAAFATSSQSWGAPLSPLAVQAVASLAPAGTAFSALAKGQGSATWGAGGNSGAVTFTDYGWDVQAGGAAGGAYAGLSQFDDWSYTFVADADGTFTMNYAVTATGATFGLWGWSILWDGPGGGLFVSNPFDPTANGVFSRALTAGQQYTVALRNNANISNPTDGINATGFMNGQFDWTIGGTPVPEPGSLAMLAFGLAGLAAARRRRA